VRQFVRQPVAAVLRPGGRPWVPVGRVPGREARRGGAGLPPSESAALASGLAAARWRVTAAGGLLASGPGPPAPSRSFLLKRPSYVAKSVGELGGERNLKLFSKKWCGKEAGRTVGAM